MANLEILIYGLIALAPNSFSSVDSIDVYLLDQRTRTFSSDRCPLHEHYPFLVFEVQREGDCESDKMPLPCEKTSRRVGNKKLSGTLCWCNLSRHDILIEPTPKLPSPRLRIGLKPNKEKPGNDSEAENAAWVPRIENITGDGKIKSWPKINRDVVARMKVMPSKIKSCGLANQEDSSGEVRTYSFQFRPSASLEPVSPHRQALAESVLIQETFAEDDVVLKLKLFGSNDKLTVGYICQGGTCSYLWIGNTTWGAEQHDDEEELCSQDFVGRDFEAYYRLAETEAIPGFVRNPVPHLQDNPVKNIKSDQCLVDPIFPCEVALFPKTKRLRHFTCNRLVTGRAICPMAVFED